MWATIFTMDIHPSSPEIYKGKGGGSDDQEQGTKGPASPKPDDTLSRIGARRAKMATVMKRVGNSYAEVMQMKDLSMTGGDKYFARGRFAYIQNDHAQAKWCTMDLEAREENTPYLDKRRGGGFLLVPYGLDT